MADKYNIKDELTYADETLQGSLSLIGMTMLTHPQYNNAMRSTMNTSHLRQFKNLQHPDFPGFFTNGENTVGENSDGYKKIKNDSTVFRKVVKYGEMVETPNVYKLFIYDEKKEQYDVITRVPSEDLPEMFGYDYDNTEIDSWVEGDFISEGTIAYHSVSYDSYMNYSFGRNVPTMYTLEPWTSEDAMIISDDLPEELATIESEYVRTMLNGNTYPLNLYGNENTYKPFPNIGESVNNGILFATRPKINNQVLFDFEDSRLMSVNDGDTCYYIDGEVIDIDIYCNEEEIDRNSFNEQILEYLDAQDEYYREIVDVCEEIFASGKKFTNEVDYLYKRSCEMLDRKKRWITKDSKTATMFIHFWIRKNSLFEVGNKGTGRFGNKSVCACIRKKEDMPYYYDKHGVKHHVKLLINLLAIINRTTGGPLFELASNFCSRKVSEEMRDLPTLKDKEELLWKYVDMMNSDQCKKMKRTYSKLSKKEKEAYIAYCENVRIHIHQPPMWEESPIFYRLGKVKDTFDFIKPDTVYINKWGREIKCMNPAYIADMYIIVLKQTSKKGFSVRGIGAINSKGLPERSYKSKSHLEVSSSTAIRFGEFETLNFCVAMMPEEVALFHALYRTSIHGRRDLGEALLKNDEVIKVDKSYTSRVAEYFNVILKSLGFDVQFVDSDTEAFELNNDELTEFSSNEKTYLCTEYQKFLLERKETITNDILQEYGVMENDELQQMVIDEMVNGGYLIGDMHTEELVRKSVFFEQILRRGCQ